MAIDTAPADRHESRLVQRLFDFTLTRETPPRVVGDKAFDSDALDAQMAQRDGVAEKRRNGTLDASDDVQASDDFDSASMSLGYDHNGNLTGDGTYQYVFNGWNRLRKVQRVADGELSVFAPRQGGCRSA